MLGCNFKVKDVKNFKDPVAVANFVSYARCAVSENVRDGAKSCANAWRRVLDAALQRYDELLDREEGYDE